MKNIFLAKYADIIYIYKIIGSLKNFYKPYQERKFYGDFKEDYDFSM